MRDAKVVRVLVNGAYDARFKALRVTRTVGGRELDTAEIFYDLAEAGERIEDTGILPSNVEIQVEVEFKSGATIIHWGKATVQQTKLGRGAEQQNLVSRLEPYHLGGVVTGRLVWDPIADDLTTIDGDLVFNPKVDDRVLANKATDSVQYGGTGILQVFLDPESVRTTGAQAVQGGQAAKWLLSDVVYYLCWTLNPQETNAHNPLYQDLDLLFTGYEDAAVENVTIKRGMSLPAALDELLGPLGYGWFLEIVDAETRNIKIFQRGQGLGMQVFLAGPGSGAPGDCNLEEIDLDCNVGNCRNVVLAQGDWVHIESTFPLTKGWAQTYDTRNADTELAKTSDNYKQHPEYHPVWRNWVLNEAGDMNGARTETTGLSSTNPYNLTALYTAATEDEMTVAPKRRKFLPCLTQGADGAPIGDLSGIDVEYSLTGPDGPWYPHSQLADTTCHVLERQCGIRFAGEHVPIELYNAGEAAAVRATATIKFDRRLSYTSNADDTSPLAEAALALVDCHDRFQLRVLATTSKFFPLVESGQLTADQANDSYELRLFADKLMNAWNFADAGGTLRLAGLDDPSGNDPYDLTEVVYAVAGRDLSLECSHGIGGNPLNTTQPTINPQIVKIEYGLAEGAQYRVLHVETYRQPEEGTGNRE